MKKCSNCDSEIRPRVSSMIEHSRKHKGKGSYTARIVLACECTVESPKATELDSIKFNGEMPSNWK